MFVPNTFHKGPFNLYVPNTFYKALFNLQKGHLCLREENLQLCNDTLYLGSAHLSKTDDWVDDTVRD